MGERTGIAWAHATFNPWWGCVEVSPACDHCYARELSARQGFGVWGKDAPRRFFGDKHWDGPFRWSRRAERLGIRLRVFCASMADVLEERGDAVGRELDRARLRLWFTILNTPALDWLLLTKRPGAYRRLVPAEILERRNVWPGVTVESQEYLWRFAEVAKVRCAGPRWISYEPALGPLDLGLKRWGSWPATMRCPRCGGTASVPVAGGGAACPLCLDSPEGQGWFSAPQWVVAGGESGERDQVREFDLAWPRGVVGQCGEGGIARFVKQMGSKPVDSALRDVLCNGERHYTRPAGDPFIADCEARIADGRAPGYSVVPHRVHLRDRAGADPTEWPEELRVQEFPA